MRQVLVVEWKTDTWRVRARGPTDTVVRFRQKRDAVNFARARAHRLQDQGALVQMVVKTKRGRIAYEATYGEDPRRSKG